MSKDRTLEEQPCALLYFDGINYRLFDRDNLCGVDPATLAVAPLATDGWLVEGSLLRERNEARRVAKGYRDMVPHVVNDDGEFDSAEYSHLCSLSFQWMMEYPWLKESDE